MKLRPFLIASALSLSFAACAQGQPSGAVSVNYSTTQEDSLLVVEMLSDLSRDRDLPVPELMLETGRMLLGRPYVAGTLDASEKESVGIYPTKQDCIIFVETCLDLALAVKQGREPSFGDFAGLVLLSRYRDGRAGRYSDRIHYTTEWIRHNEARGVLRDITVELGGVPYDHPIDYMGTHPDAYAHLRDADSDPEAARDLEVIREVEARLNAVPMTYIPKDKVPECLPGMAPGDIICFVTAVKGLDIAHVGLYLGDGRFMHASSARKKVVEEELTLPEYLGRVRNHVGIKVARPDK
ncbi:MAG: DUF1460 domain-containing protein [Bacteroidales bacterium]|nr:DUF1460 domain-containing protein [Bacteroidales bacterium]